MDTREFSRKSRSGFTTIELLIVVAIIGTLASVAIPIFASYQLRAKSSEVKTHLAAIRIAEEAEYGETGQYVRADAEPIAIPGTAPAAFNVAGSDFAALGWNPEGNVYFSYAVETTADGTGYTIDAAADIDGDGLLQIWGITKPNGLGLFVAGGMGCNPALLAPEEIGSCIVGPIDY